MELVDFAYSHGLDCSLSTFSTHAPEVWKQLQAVKQSGDAGACAPLVHQWISEGDGQLIIPLLQCLLRIDVSVSALFDQLIGRVMRQVGLDYLSGKLSIGEEHRLSQTIRDMLVTLSTTRPLQAKDRDGATPRAIVGCMRGEVHELGALMVRVMLECHGWQVIYIGLNVPTEEFAALQKSHRASLVCVSMMPPVGLPEAMTMVRLLNSVYDPAQPYRLVIGGGAFTHGDQEQFDDSPIEEISLFGSMTPFESWLANLPEGA